MGSPWYAGLLNILPESAAGYLIKKFFDSKLNKYADINVEGITNIEGIKEPVIFISNHLSNSDGLVLNRVLAKQNVTFVAGVKLSQNSFTKLGGYVVKTINIKPNSADKDAISNIIKTLKNGGNILIFPEGTRSRTGSMMEAKRGILLIQKLSKAKIIPIGITGTEELLPINDTGMEKEEFHNAKVNVNIGKVLDIVPKEKEEDRRVYEEKTLNYVMKSISELLPEEYRGIYS